MQEASLGRVSYKFHLYFTSNNKIINNNYNNYIVFTTQVNSAFGAWWGANTEVIVQVLFTPELWVAGKILKVRSFFSLLTVKNTEILVLFIQLVLYILKQ